MCALYVHSSKKDYLITEVQPRTMVTSDETASHRD